MHVYVSVYCVRIYFYINRKWTSKIGRVRKQKLFGQSLCLDPTMTYADVILRCYVSAICLFICFF